MKRLACYFPLIAIGFEIAWVILLVLGFIFAPGDPDHAKTDAGNRLFDLVASLPVVSGLVVGLVALAARFPVRRLEWIALIVGVIACAILAVSFVSGLAI